MFTAIDHRADCYKINSIAGFRYISSQKATINKKTSKNQMNIDSDVCYVSTRSSGKIYISSLRGGNTNYICHYIDFIYSDEIYGTRRWLTAQIECRIFDDNDMFPNDIILRHMSVTKPLMDDFKNIYTLPRKYWGIINKIIENGKH